MSIVVINIITYLCFQQFHNKIGTLEAANCVYFGRERETDNINQMIISNINRKGSKEKMLNGLQKISIN